MTTQARELAKLVTNAGDVNLGDDISLASDGAILNFGADNDVTLTHVADTGLLLNSSRQLQFGDSGTFIRQEADGVLDLTSDTEIEINATTVDINANVDISGNLVLGGNITIGDADSDDISFGGELTSHIVPNVTNTYDLGTSSKEWRNAYFDGTVTADAFAGPLTGNVTGNVSGTAATVTTAAQTNITSVGNLTALTVQKASSGASATSNTVLTIEDDDNTEVSILGGSSSVLAINFGHSGDNDEGLISFNTTAGSEDMILQSTKDITLRTTSTNSTAGDINFKSYNTTIMHIDGGNNRVGIGETTPLGFLHVKNGDSGQGSVNAAGNSLVLESNGATGITFLSGSSSNTSIIMGDSESNYRGVLIYDHSADAMKFVTAGSEAIYIDTNQNVGIGGTPTNGGISGAASPALAIIGTVPELNFVDTSSSANDYWIRVSDGLQFGEASDSRMYLKNGGNLGIGTTSPDSMLHLYKATGSGALEPELKIENNHNTSSVTDGAGRLTFYSDDSNNSGIPDSAWLGQIRFMGDDKDGSAQEFEYGYIVGAALDPGSGTSRKGRIDFYNRMGNSVSLMATMRQIHQSGTTGAMGINEVNPAYTLDVNTTGESNAFRLYQGTGSGKDVSMVLQNVGSGTGDESIISLYTAAGAGDAKIRFAISGNETWEMGIDNSDSDKLKISNGTGLGTTDSMVVGGGAITFKQGGSGAHIHTIWNNGQTSVADDALIDLDSMCNTAALVIVQNRYDGASIKYVSAVFFVDYQNGNAPDKLSDPDDAFHNGDVDGKNCLFKNGNGSFRYKNRSGVTNQTVIHVLEFQGN